MVEFIIKYWVEFAFGLVTLGLGAIAKHYYSLAKESKKTKEEAFMTKIHEDIESSFKKATATSLEQVVDANRQTTQESLNRFNLISTKLAEHEKEAKAEYNKMFSTLHKEIENVQSCSDKNEKALTDSITVLTEGVLNIQGRDFKKACRELLDPNHNITEEEYEEISHDHDVYNKLGGNHNGDTLFEAVKAKYQNHL
jgi:hypothetical protein